VDELTGRTAPVFLDEVQELPEWQRLVRSLLDRNRPVCITGSNASLLGRELASKLTGRLPAPPAALLSVLTLPIYALLRNSDKF